MLTLEHLLWAYSNGFFPMADSRESCTIRWFEPKRRGILPLENFHVPRRLQRTLRHCRFHVRYNTAFSSVIAACAAASARRPHTWINEEIIRAYTLLHHLGFAHSVECWYEENLVGGLYGVALGGAFFGESMFTYQTDASKVALVSLVERLRKARFSLLDTQFFTDHLGRFGAIEVSLQDYHSRLKNALTTKVAPLFGLEEQIEGKGRIERKQFS